MKILLNCLILLLLNGSLFSDNIALMYLKPKFKFGGVSVDSEKALFDPSAFIVTENKVIVSDRKANQIIFFSRKGDLIQRIGKPGNGPGDLLDPGKITLWENKLIVSDTGNHRIQAFSKKGNYLNSYRTLTLEEFGGEIWFTKDGRYLSTTEGYNSSHLITLHELEGEATHTFGKIFGEKTGIFKMEIELIKKGKIPNHYKNRVFPLDYNTQFIYCVHKSLPIVKKFSIDGKLAWKSELDFPEKNEIFKKWVTTNKNAPQNVTYRLEYWKDVQIDELGNLYLLLGLSQKTIIYRLSIDGIIDKKYQADEKIDYFFMYKNELWGLGKDNHIFYKYNF